MAIFTSTCHSNQYVICHRVVLEKYPAWGLCTVGILFRINAINSKQCLLLKGNQYVDYQQLQKCLWFLRQNIHAYIVHKTKTEIQLIKCDIKTHFLVKDFTLMHQEKKLFYFRSQILSYFSSVPPVSVVSSILNLSRCGEKNKALLLCFYQ